MSVTVTRVSAAGLRSVIWTFPAPEPPQHPALGNVSVAGAMAATAVRWVIYGPSEARVAVTIESRLLPDASLYGEASRESRREEQARIAATRAVDHVMAHMRRRGIGQ